MDDYQIYEASPSEPSEPLSSMWDSRGDEAAAKREALKLSRRVSEYDPNGKAVAIVKLGSQHGQTVAIYQGGKKIG